MARKSPEALRPGGTPTESISASRAASIYSGELPASLRDRQVRGGSGRDAPFSNVSLVGNLDDRMFAGRTDVFARFEALVDKSVALGGAHAFDDRFIIELGQVARHRGRRNFFAEEAEPQRVKYAALVDAGHAIQPVHAENIEVRHRIRIERFLRQRQLN